MNHLSSMRAKLDQRSAPGLVWSLVLAMTCGLIISASAAVARELKAAAPYFVDHFGRVVILRGVNVGAATKVSAKAVTQDIAGLARLPELGFNVIRVPFIWEHYEPVAGQIDDAYLSSLQSLVDEAWQLGLYSIVDFHQDSYSAYVGDGCGSGFPEFTVPLALRSAKSAPDCSSFWAVPNLMSSSLPKSFDAFYSGAGGVRDRYLALWGTLAAAFRDHKGVIGYDLLNEPWGQESKQLLPLYEKAAAVIRAQDPDAILFIEPDVHTVAGTTATSLPKPSFANYAYAPHFYAPVPFVTHIWTTLDPSISSAAARLEREASALQAPLFIGEFGVDPTTLGAASDIALQYSRMDEVFASGTQWNYSPEWTPKRKDGWNSENYSIIDGHGNLRDNFSPRAYAQKISGVPLAMAYDPKAQTFTLSWTHDPKAGETEIYFPPPIGVDPSIFIESDDLTCAFVGTTRATCRSSTPGPKALKIVVRPTLGPAPGSHRSGD